MNHLQLQASNPNTSIWVSASAGTGKTKILTDRVLRLLLQDVEFNKILCLTFTNAAAHEMQARIIESLASWSVAQDEELARCLANTIGHYPANHQIKKAKALYAQYLRSEEKMHIQTIHSFCQKLLKKFPLEAGISPSFKIIDDTKSHVILYDIKTTLLNQKTLEPINQYLTSHFHSITIDEILNQIIGNKLKFLKAFDANHNIQHNTNLEISDKEYIYNEAIRIISLLQKNFDHSYSRIVQNTSIANHVIGELLGNKPSLDTIKNFFLTKTGQKKKRLVPKKIASPDSELYSELLLLQDEIYTLDQYSKAYHIEHYSELISLLAKNIIGAYDAYKLEHGLMDYDDLILYTSNLLRSSDAKEWVLYKLDGGIDHLLVDEAQDTSSDQWQIIEALISEFYSGESNIERGRTLFVVGDDKQSIFSFQGANIESFKSMNDLFHNKMVIAHQVFKNINLEISYRSAPQILEIIYCVFKSIQQQMPEAFANQLIELTPFRLEAAGHVELWPLTFCDTQTEQFWPIITDNHQESQSKVELAHKISDYIKDQIDNKILLASTGQYATEGDFMILFRKRDELTHEVITALQNNQLDVTGLDRIILKDHLAILDLLSIAKFVINYNDELNLIALLKSPLINLSENALQSLILSARKTSQSIWEYIIERKELGAAEYQNIVLSRATQIGENSEINYKQIYFFLNRFIQVFYATNVTNFFQYIVDILGYRHILNAALGSESNDAIDELLYASNNFAEQDMSLQNFILWLENYETSVKRDNITTNKIKIMTVHASKGLQSPVVILCDTTSIPTNSERFYWENNQMFSTQSSNKISEHYQNLKSLASDKDYAEYLRLLYVGMTRAEDHLIICGYQGAKSISEHCWYALVKNTMQERSHTMEDHRLIYGTYSHRTRLNNSRNTHNANHIEYFTPYIAQENILSQDINKTNKIYSTDQKHSISSPLSIDNPMQYGLVFHKILEDAVNVKNLSLMTDHPLINTLDNASQIRIKRSIGSIIENETFNALISKNCQVEVSIGSKCEEEVKIIRIDLIIIDQNKLFIIDYKSDKNPATNQDQIPESYLAQISSYVDIVQTIYPNKIIKSMILWLESGDLTHLT